MAGTGRQKVWLLLASVFYSSLVFSTATVSGNLQDAGGSAVSSRTFVRFWLRGCANNQPRVNGVALIVPPGGPGYYKDFVPDAGGAISGAIYKNSEIECNGLTGNTWYGVQVFRDGKPGPETPYSVVAATFNLNTATPTVQAPPPPPATFPYIMANPIAAQTISNFPLAFGSGSGISANYQGSVRAAGTYLRSDGSSFFAPVSGSQVASDIVSGPNLNGLAYWNGTSLSTTQAGGAGTLCLVSTNGGAPAFSSCAGSSSTAWSALSAPSSNLALNMGLRSTTFTWGTGTLTNNLLTVDASGANGSGGVFLIRPSPGSYALRIEAAGLPGDYLLEAGSIGGIAIGPTGSPLASYGIFLPSNGSPATEFTKLVSWNGTTAVRSSTSDTLGKVIGICMDRCGTGTVPGVVVAVAGIASCLFDTANTAAGNWAVVSTTVAGMCHDSGTTTRPPNVTAIGRILDNDTSGQSKILLAISDPVGTRLTNTASLDYDLSGAGITCQDLTITVTGAAAGDAVSLGVPNALASSAGVQLTGWVSAADTVTVRACDVTTSNPNPAAATVHAEVWKF